MNIWALSFQEPKSEIIITISDQQSDFLCFSFKKDFKYLKKKTSKSTLGCRQVVYLENAISNKTCKGVREAEQGKRRG